MKGHGLTTPCTLLLAVTVFAVAACNGESDRAIVLNEFDEVSVLSPIDSVNLESFGIYGAYKAIPYDGWYAVHKLGGSNALDIISIQNKEKIECLRIGRGPGEVSHIGGIQEYAGNIYEAVAGVDALLIVTEWKEFRMPDWASVLRAMKSPVIFDGRNIYDPAEMKELGFIYRSIGRPQH